MFDINDGKASAPDLIPAGTISFAMVKIGAAKQSGKTGGTMYPVELTLLGGQHEGRKVFELLPDITDARNSDKWRAMGKTNLVRMFETAGVFKPSDPGSYTQFGQNFLGAMNRLDGQRVAIKINIEKSQDPAYGDKNKVADYLSSNPTSGGHRDFLKLIGGQGAVVEARGQAFAPPVTAAAPAGAAPGWIKTPTPAPSPSSDAPF